MHRSKKVEDMIKEIDWLELRPLATRAFVKEFEKSLTTWRKKRNCARKTATLLIKHSQLAG